MKGWGLAVTLAVVAIASAAFAQPLPDPLVDNRAAAGGGAKIPVTMPGDPEVLGAERAAATAPAAPVSIEQPIDPNTYICGPGDTFELNFWGQQNFRLKIAVDLEGRTFISKVGFVTVAGKTLETVRKAITQKVRANYPGLQFELTLATPRTFLVHLVENVSKPGIYAANPVERLSSVLARAGGVTGSRRRIAIRHRDGTSTTADLVLYELTGNTEHNPYLIDGDVVSVPSAETTVSITGAIHRPGNYELIKTNDLSELLDLAGGFTSGVARSLPIRVVGRNDKQQELFQNLAFTGTGAPNTRLHDQDQVLVPGAAELQRSVLLIGAVVGAETVDAASTSKRLPFVEGDSVWSLIERAGGIKAPGDLKRSYIARPQPNGPPKVIPIDLDAVLVRRDFRADMPIAMGDTIVIPPMQYSILIEGSVARAGLYPYNPVFGVPEYIAHAGGRTHNAEDMDAVRIIEPSGATRPYSEKTPLHPGDAILVPERNWTRGEIVQIVMGSAGLLLSAVAIGYAVTR
jgi:protein involved in polysaccharide export with SLBB domain